MPPKLLAAALAAGAVLLAFAVPEQRGRELFGRRCGGCHAADLNKEGLKVRGVYGRKAATVPGFVYSDALKKTGIVWDDATLDRWLTDPNAIAPGTDMDFRLASAEERRAVIEYLKGGASEGSRRAAPPSTERTED